MEFFKQLISPLEWLIERIDNGEFFKKPLGLFYMLCGAASALGCLAIVYLVYDYYHFALEYTSGWTYFVLVLMLICVVLGMILMAIYSFYYWYVRAKRTNEIVGQTEKVKAIPVVGDFLQTIFEVFGLQVIALVCYISTLAFMFRILTWSFYDSDQFFISLGTWIGCIVGSCIIGYLSTIFGHFIGERCRVWALVGNNIEGIHRSLKSIANEDEAAEVVIAEEAE